jgi:hypothetical protein
LTAAAVEGVTADPGKVFDELGAEAVVTARDHPLSFWLGASPVWRVIAEDDVAVAAVRQEISCATAAGAHEATDYAAVRVAPLRRAMTSAPSS